jgi:hypothetical protein
MPTIAVALALACTLVGCTGGPPGDAAHSGVGALDPDFLGGVATPSPEATINPSPGSWDDVSPEPGYRVVVISSERDAAGAELVDAVTDWGARVGATIETHVAADDDEVDRLLTEAVAEEPDLVLGAGAGIVDVFFLLTAQHIGQQFLVLGAQVPEPTENVTAVIWDGASFRGTGISTEADIDADAVTTQRAADAIEAGVASILHGYTGIVVNLPEG